MDLGSGRERPFLVGEREWLAALSSGGCSGQHAAEAIAESVVRIATWWPYRTARQPRRSTVRRSAVVGGRANGVLRLLAVDASSQSPEATASQCCHGTIRPVRPTWFPLVARTWE